MRKHGFLFLVTAILAVMMCGCENKSGIDLPANSGVPEMQTSSTAPFLTVIPNSEYSVENEFIGINPDVVWAIGKTFDDVSEKYGGVVGGALNKYTFKNGYASYVWKDSEVEVLSIDEITENPGITKKFGTCTMIDNIKASDFLIGSISTLSYDEFAEKCGVEFTRFTEPAMDNCYYGYFKHPSFDVYFAVYTTEKDKIDENAHFVIGMNENIW